MATGRHDERQRRQVDRVEAGWFKLGLTRGGWQVPCRIQHDRALWRATIDGFEQKPHPDPWRAEGVSDIHTYGLRITEEEYRHLLEVKAWAREHDQSHPALWPQRRIEPSLLRPLFPRNTAHGRNPD